MIPLPQPITVADLLDQIKARGAVQSDYAIAKALGVTTSEVSNWRSGRKFPGKLARFGLAELVGRRPSIVIAEIEICRAWVRRDMARFGAWTDMLATLVAKS